MKRIILLLLSIFLFSCKSQFNFENSTFFYKNKIGNTLINFSKDGRFNFSRREGGLIELKSTGNWKKTANKVMLTSDEIYKTGIISVKEKIDNSFDKVKVVIKDSIGFINGAGLIIDNKNTYNTNYKGVVLLLKKPTNFIISYLGEKYAYSVKDEKSNIIEITLNLNNLTSYYFDNEVWRLNKNILINSWDEKMILR